MFTAVLVSILIFLLMRVAPGDVAMAIAVDMNSGEEAMVTEEQLEKIRKSLGLHDPIHLQYIKWAGGFLVGDWGKSLFSGRQVFDEFKQRLPVTVELSILSVFLSTVMGIPAGIYMALKQDRWTDYLLRIWSLAGLSVPNFWLATMFVVAGLYMFNWIPPLGYVSFFDNPIQNLQQFIPPALILGYSSMAVKARMMRSTMLEVMRQDYIRTAHAKGLKYWVVIYHHAMKNAFIPVLTVIGISIAFIMGGTVIIERIFTLLGEGDYLIRGMNDRDYPIVQSLVLFFAMWIVLVNIVIDLMYGWIDPRIRFS